ncbi:MAG: hypothetical protein IPN01_06980 [Deltaproteobacteria bacterium]|nr:hypothetical protein [Deltaproteobacteria bacterium]
MLLVSEDSVVLHEVHPNLHSSLQGWLKRPIQTMSEISALRDAIREAEYLARMDDVAPSIWILPAPLRGQSSSLG